MAANAVRPVAAGIAADGARAAARRHEAEADLSNQLWKYFDVALRLPFLFLMDQLLLHDMGVNFFESKNVSSSEGHVHFTVKQHFRAACGSKESFFNSFPESYTYSAVCPADDSDLSLVYERLYGSPDWQVLPHVAPFLLTFGVYLAAMVMVLSLNTAQLLSFYSHLVSVLLVPLTYCVSVLTTKMIHDDGLALAGSIQVLASLLLVMGFAAANLQRMHRDGGEGRLACGVVFFSGVVPSLLAMCGLPLRLLNLAAPLCAVPPALVTASTVLLGVKRVLRTVADGVEDRKRTLDNFGPSALLETELKRLNLPTLLRAFWLTRLAQQVLSSTIRQPPSLSIVRDLVSGSVETFVALLGMTSVVSAVVLRFGSFAYGALSSSEGDNEEAMASVSTILFLILAVQSGLTSLEPQKRLVRLFKNLCLVLAAIFHFIHHAANHTLLELAASSAVRYGKHLKALGVCVFLASAPLALVCALWNTFAVGTWLLAITAFCLDVVVKVAVTLIVYSLWIYDVKSQEGTWEGLDDAVYYVKAAGKCIEFSFAVLLFLNGVWILLYESGGTIKAALFLVHAYFNVWCVAKEGWSTFVKRRQAVQKINALPDATRRQLVDYNDVCAICYQNMEAAKLTRCQHMFHAICIRKWLHVQDSCPLCHAVLVKAKKRRSGSGEEVIDNDLVEEEEQREMPIVMDRESGSDSDGVTEESDNGGEREASSSSSLKDDGDSDLFYDSMEEYRHERRDLLPRRRRSGQLRVPRLSSSAENNPDGCPAKAE